MADPKMINGVLHFEVQASEHISTGSRGSKYKSSTIWMSTEEVGQLYNAHKGDSSFTTERNEKTYRFDGDYLKQKYWEMQRFERHSDPSLRGLETSAQTITTELPGTGGSTLKKETEFTVDAARWALYKAGGDDVSDNRRIPVTTTNEKTAYVQASELRSVIATADYNASELAREKAEIAELERQEKELKEAEAKALKENEAKAAAEKAEAEKKAKKKPQHSRPASQKTSVGKDFKKAEPTKKETEHVASKPAASRNDDDKPRAETVSHSSDPRLRNVHLTDRQAESLAVIVQALSGDGLGVNSKARDAVLEIIAPLLQDYVTRHRAEHSGKGHEKTRTARVTRAYETNTPG